MLFKLYLRLKQRFTNEYFIDFTKDSICIKKYPDTILINSKFDDFPYNSQYKKESDSFLHLFFRIFQKQNLTKYNNKYFDSFFNLSFSMFINALQIIKITSKKSFVRPRIFMSIPPNLSLKDKESINNILKVFNVRAICFIDRILAIMCSTKIENKKIAFYINSQKCYRTIYFAGGLYDITELDCSYYSITNQNIDDYISDLKNKVVQMPEDFSLIKKNNKDLFFELEKLWLGNFDETIYIIFETNPTLINENQNNIFKINSSTSELSIKGIELFFESIRNKK